MKFISDVKKNKVLLLMTMPVVIIIFLIKYCPMFGVIMAFEDFQANLGIFGSKFVGFKNFEFLFKTADAWNITRNTLGFNILFIVLNTTCAIFVAIMFDSLGRTKLNSVNQILILFPHFISWMVGSYFVYALLSPDKGLINSLRAIFGADAVRWYSNPVYWVFILPVCNIWKGVGYSSVIYFSTIKGFNVEYYEAARIDGASWLKQIRYITLPLLKPIVIVMFILSIGGIFNSDFGLFYLVTKNSGALYTVTSTIDTYVYNGLMSGGNLGMTTATGLYQSAVGFLTVVLANFVVRKVSPEDAMF